MFNIKFRWGLIIAMAGFIGLTFTLIEDSGMGGKIPMTIFFFLVMIIGLYLEMIPKEEQTYGEFEGKRGFG